MPAVGDESTHVCFTPLIAYASFATLMLSLAYFLYALLMPVQPMTRSQRKQQKAEVAKRGKKISAGKIA